MSTLTPLEDPTYIPAHPPIDGKVPDIVAKWGPRSQLRYFDRFEIKMPAREWAKFFCESEFHRGLCCASCREDGEIFEGGICCCQGLHDGD